MIRILLLSVGLVAIQPSDWSVQGSNLAANFLSKLPKFNGTPIKEETKRTQPDPEQEEVVWTSTCSPRWAGVRRGQDARLECQVVVPSGAVLSWYKDDAPMHQDTIHDHDRLAELNSTEQELLEEETNMLSLEEAQLPAAAPISTSRVKISSVVYLDCVADQHQATYKMEVKTPHSRKTHSRLFTVIIVGDEHGAPEMGPTCQLGPLVAILPRIYQHALVALGPVGDSVTLPCRSQGKNVSNAWFLDDKRIQSDSNDLQILPTGDLVVRLSQRGHRRFMCKATSTRFSRLSDAVVTEVIAK